MELDFFAVRFVRWPMKMLALDAAVNRGTATTATLQLLRSFLTSGTAVLVIGFIHTSRTRRILMTRRKIICKILVERRKESSKPRTAASQRNSLLLPFAGFNSSR